MREKIRDIIAVGQCVSAILLAVCGISLALVLTLGRRSSYPLSLARRIYGRIDEQERRLAHLESALSGHQPGGPTTGHRPGEPETGPKPDDSTSSDAESRDNAVQDIIQELRLLARECDSLLFGPPIPAPIAPLTTDDHGKNARTEQQLTPQTETEATAGESEDASAKSGQKAADRKEDTK